MEPRALSDREKSMVEALLRYGDAAEEISTTTRQSWGEQIEKLQVLSACDCGQCPSVSFSATETATGDESSIILSASLPEALVMLFIVEDEIRFLELAPVTEKVFDEFPTPDELLLS